MAKGTAWTGRGSAMVRALVGRGRAVPGVPSPKPVPGGVSAKAEQILGAIESLKGRIGESFYEMGILLGELSQPSLYRALGYRSFEELLAGRRVTSRMTALRLIEVARSFPRELALGLGVEKAYALVRYAAATPAADVARELAVRDAPIAGKRVRTATVREIIAATRQLRGKGRGSVEIAPAEAKRAARALQAAFRRAGATGARATAERKDGVSWVVLRVRADQAGLVEVSG